MSAKSEVTIYDIARELDLSPSTISRALSGLSIVHKDTRSKILEKAQHLGYRRNQFASRLRSQKTHVLATVVPQLNTFFISNIVSGAEVTARQSGYNMVVNQSLQNRELLAANIEHLNKSGVDGLLVASSEIENYAHDLSAIGIPLIIIEACAELRSRSKNRTTLCNFEMAYQLTRHLAKRGCRRIAFISNASDTVRHSDILRGYRRALYDHELNNDMILIGSIGQSGIDMSREMLSGTSLPDGIIFSSDIIAALSIPEFSQPGEMKKDNRVSGFSEQPSFLNTESFSILDDAQLVHLGKVAMAILISLVENTPE